MNKLKVMTVVGTRPEIIRLSRTIAALDRECDQVLVHTGQNYDYELNQIFFDDLGIRKPDHFLEAAGRTPAETVGLVISRVDGVLASDAPDAMLLLGDTNSGLAAYPAKRRKIPVFHMEAGNRCFDERVPEEINRRIIDRLSDINLPYSGISREYLLREGFPPDRVIKTGSPMLEVIRHYMPKIEKSDTLRRLKLEPGAYFVVSLHREENVDSPRNMGLIVESLNGLAGEFRQRVIVTAHPRARARFEEVRKTLSDPIELHAPFSFTDYVHLEIHARAVLSDSGTITEESSILDFPALNIREAHERPEGMEEGAVMLTGLRWERIRQGLGILESRPRREGRTLPIVGDYDVPNVSEKVVRIILSYVDYVNRTVWRKT
jgi:UDP-N-acetylglucosamine 2-epimerase